jgi:hypothetical protein
MSSVDRSLGVGEITPTTKTNAYETAAYNRDMKAMSITGKYSLPTKKRKKK